jgi:hypothetical protein
MEKPEVGRIKDVKEISVESAFLTFLAIIKKQKRQKQECEIFRIEAEIAEPYPGISIITRHRQAGQCDQQCIPDKKYDDLFSAVIRKTDRRSQ